MRLLTSCVLRVIGGAVQAIHFQFQNEKDHDAITFSGIGMKLSELKAAIIQKRGLQTAAMTAEGKTVDLTVRNAATNAGTVSCLCTRCVPKGMAVCLGCVLCGSDARQSSSWGGELASLDSACR